MTFLKTVRKHNRDYLDDPIENGAATIAVHAWLGLLFILTTAAFCVTDALGYTFIRAILFGLSAFILMNLGRASAFRDLAFNRQVIRLKAKMELVEEMKASKHS